MNAKNNTFNVPESYVSRGGLKLASVAKKLNLDFRNKIILDIGSSTGGFSDFALQNGAKKIIAVDAGSDQMHPILRQVNNLELHEKTDIRDFKTDEKFNLVLIDVSFVSLRKVLPIVLKFCDSKTQIVALLKPQFEAAAFMKNRGVIKNEHLRRGIIKDFELWAKKNFLIKAKADSKVEGNKGNLERFYLLVKLQHL